MLALFLSRRLITKSQANDAEFFNRELFPRISKSGHLIGQAGIKNIRIHLVIFLDFQL
jgi:hypothetical protein